MKKTIFITGATGMLGKKMVEAFSGDEQYRVYGVSRSKQSSENVIYENIDLLNENAIMTSLEKIKPEVVIQCAANVNLEECEKDQEAAYQLHVGSTKILASYSPNTTKFVYISTDSVFDGRKGDYTEDDPVNPLNYYSKSKYLGEQAALENNKNTLVVRTNIYGINSARGRSLVEWAMNELKNDREINGFDDVYFNPVYVGQLAKIIKKLLEETKISGTINIASAQKVSKYEFLKALAEVFGFNTELIHPVSIDTMPSKFERPKDTALNTDKLKKAIGEVPTLKKGLCEMSKSLR
ncbi:MAG: dTDP-4-dehydrorhamnose reductase [Eubacteriaceae bacterium]|nr:dTDP-4-dehydrorhamnose reductase [Eubacteriaceae bacterium]